MKDTRNLPLPPTYSDEYAFAKYGRDMVVGECLKEILATVAAMERLSSGAAPALSADDYQLIVERLARNLTNHVETARQRARKLDAAAHC